MPEAQPRALREVELEAAASNGLRIFSYNAPKNLLCRCTIHFTVPYIFNWNTYNCQSQVARDRQRRSDLAEVHVSDVDRRSNTIHVRGAFSFARCALAVSNEVKRRLSWSNGKGFPLVSEGDGAVVRTLRTEHCFVTCDNVLTFFAVPKTTANYFLWNWNRKLANSSLPSFVYCKNGVLICWGCRLSSAVCPTVSLIGLAVSSHQPGLKKIGNFLPAWTTPMSWPTSKHSAIRHVL